MNGTKGQTIRRLGSPLVAGVSPLVPLWLAKAPFGRGYAMLAWCFGLGILVMAVAIPSLPAHGLGPSQGGR